MTIASPSDQVGASTRSILLGVALAIAAMLAALWGVAQLAAGDSRPVVADSNGRAAALAALRGAPGIVEAQWSGDSGLWLLVHDDGSKWIGVAEATCPVLARHRVRGYVTVRVWDAGSMLSANPRELAKTACR